MARSIFKDFLFFRETGWDSDGDKMFIDVLVQACIEYNMELEKLNVIFPPEKWNIYVES